MTRTLIDQAVKTIRGNDRGTYTVPTAGLYPFQWNWDSALSSLGFSHFDESRAWTEVETLFAHQWEDGMVPHIIFHEPDDGYFPGPDVWNTGRAVPTSGITQPPVAAHCVRKLFERARDKVEATRRARALLPRMQAWHDWFHRCRDPEGTGLVAILHPWESGRDNSIDWDAAFERVPTDGVGNFRRRDTDHADASHRPTDEQYKRYIWLVQHFRALGWDNTRLHDASPFQIEDPGFNAILIRSCSDLAALANALGEQKIAEQAQAQATRGLAALDALWSNTHGQYLCRDRTTGVLVDSPSIGGLLAVFAPISEARAAQIAARIEGIASRCDYLVPSHDPAAAEFDGKRYWRGPVWLIVNFMIADGLAAAGEWSTSRRIFEDSLRLIERSGFAEYHDPITGAPCGGATFTWTAAMVLEILSTEQAMA